MSGTTEKSSPVGYAAKMREALERIRDMVDAARSASPRNCDVGTVGEQLKRFGGYCFSHHKKPVPAAFFCCGCSNVAIGCVRCLLAWMHLPYEEGGEDADK